MTFRKPRDTWLFGKLLRVSSTNVVIKTYDRPSDNLDKVKMMGIGQSASLLPTFAKTEYGRVSEIAKVSVVEEGLVILRRHKVRSILLGRPNGIETATKRLLLPSYLYSCFNKRRIQRRKQYSFSTQFNTRICYSLGFLSHHFHA